MAVKAQLPQAPWRKDSQSNGWPTGLMMLIAFAGIIIFAAGLKNVASLIGPTFLALSLVIAIRPFHKWMIEKGLPKMAAVAVSLITLYGILVALIWALVYSVMELVQILPTYASKFENLYNQASTLLESWGVSQTQISDQTLKFLEPSRVMGWATTALSGLSSVGSLLFVLVMVLAFLVVDSGIISGRGQFLREKHPNLSYALEDFSYRTSRYWVVNTVFGLIVAAIDVVALLILGVPLAFVWGIFSFVTNYIPNIGFVLGLVPPALIALLDGDWKKMLWVVVLYCVINFSMQQIVQPKVTGDAVGLNTTVTFLSLMIWSSIIGALGAILAVPLTLAVKALFIDSDPRTRWINVFFSTDFMREEGALHVEKPEIAHEDQAASKVASNVPVTVDPDVHE